MIENTSHFYEKLEKDNECFGEMFIISLVLMEKISYQAPKNFIPWKAIKLIEYFTKSLVSFSIFS